MGDTDVGAPSPETTGAWVINHSNKLASVVKPDPAYEQIAFAGRCGLVLNALAKSSESFVRMRQVENLARAVGINARLELPQILNELVRQRLIDRGSDGVQVLGLGTLQTLAHTASIFEESEPGSVERAALTIAEWVSERPLVAAHVAPRVSDVFEIPASDVAELLAQFSEYGFVDVDTVGNESVYFNGNLFRNNEAKRVQHVLDSLSAAEAVAVSDAMALLKSSGCVSATQIERIVGDRNFSRLVQVGFFDISEVGNEHGTHRFVTTPSAFQKFGRGGLEDAFDLAKAFVSSLTYGMNVSHGGRGRIQMIAALMGKLLAGEWIGPATAIGQDYRVLELRGVVQVRPYEGGRFFMKLLKRDIGELALQVVQEGAVGASPLLELPGAAVSLYREPEVIRTTVRKRAAQLPNAGIRSLVEAIRMGGMG